MQKSLIILLILVFGLSLGCTSSDTFIIQNTKLEKLFDGNISGDAGLIPFLNLDGNKLEVSSGLDFNSDTNTLSTNCLELGDGNTYCSSTDFPNPDLSPYWKSDGTSSATGNWDLGAHSITLRDINVTSNLIVDTDTLYVDSATGNVGIGMTNPNHPLSIIGKIETGDETKRYTMGKREGYDQLLFENAYTGSNAYTTMWTDNAGVGTNSKTQMGFALFNVDVDALGYGSKNYGGMVYTTSEITQMGGLGADSSDVQIMAGGNEAIRVKTNGNIGIGMTNPNHPLSIIGKIETGDETKRYTMGKREGYDQLLFENAYTGSNAYTTMWTDNAGVGTNSKTQMGFALFNVDVDALGYGSKNYGGIVYTTSEITQMGGLGADSSDVQIMAGGNEAIRVKTNGNIGIGTITADEKLEVNGNIYLKDNDKSLFGTLKDASIYHDGDNLVINPKEVGSGYLSVLGDIDAGANTIRTTGDVKGIHKTADGTNPVADGTYTMGLGGTSNGTITIKDGIIIAIQEAVP